MIKPLIAVVDDDPVVQKLMTMLLTHEGYEVILWSDGETAYEMIRRWCPDLVTLDLCMQGDRDAGLKVLQCLHANPITTHIPVIIVSGTTDTLHGQAKCLRTLTYAHLLKPVPFETLLDHIATALQLAAMRLS